MGTKIAVWPDVSSNQPVYEDDAFTFDFVMFRILDGTFHDPKGATNLLRAKAACNQNKLLGFGVYIVFPRSEGVSTAEEVFAEFVKIVGVPHERMCVMIDIEDWSGHVKGNHTAEIEKLRILIWKYLR